ncbi:EamA family transporter [Rheinheimera sp. 4Y26]|uniref:EamA family transporter n=1 Tax=Rheinheimera sp. 4Y26 TaxID=2977811 RepID=UPI0021B0D495|nr:EamA family transporter [Rheinheimera sp. 4Y26]MCT6698616.1 EamA family transporter [Rheinheimera sp. 4Y26]
MSSRSYTLALLCGVLAAIIWGSTYVVTTELLPPDRPLLASLARALPAGLLLLLWQRQLPQGHWWWRSALLGSLNIGVFFYCLFVAAYHLPGGVAALVMSCQPVLVMLFSVFLLHEKLRLRPVLAAGIASGGVALLVSVQGAALSVTGVVAGVLGAASMALGIVLSKKWPKPADISLVTFTGWQLLAGGLLLLPLALYQEGLPDRISLQNLAGYSYLCLIGAVLAYLLWFRALQRLPAVTLSFLTFTSPVSALVFGYLVLNQQLTLQQSLGAVAILLAIVLAQRPPAPVVPAADTSLTPLPKGKF